MLCSNLVEMTIKRVRYMREWFLLVISLIYYISYVKIVLNNTKLPSSNALCFI